MRPGDEDSDDSSSEHSSGDDSGPLNSESDSSDTEPPPKRAALKMTSKARRGFEKPPFRSNREPIKCNDIDPMDPAAYSDTCPRGKWLDGLSNVRDE